ncbi:MAG: sugar phosphate isomerase/epimerase [Chloroflexi bacterium]|nr:sugar phosphate isomerase/epimerase [Chloroflexota bacterium]
MKVGLDALTLHALKLSALEYVDKLLEYRLEGMQYFSQAVRELDADTRREFTRRMAEHGLYLELTGAGVNPGKSGKSIAEMVEPWKPLFALANEVGATILNTCFGLLKERTFDSPTLQEQIALTTEVLTRLAPIAAAHDVTVTMELHVDLTSKELARIIADVNSPYVRVNLDTANALGLLEDPVEAATTLKPYIYSTHYKDSCIYLTDEGYNWQGGAPLGMGLAELPTVTQILYEAKPDIHLNIEDSFGFIPIPFYDAAFINSFPDLTPEALVRFVRILRKGEALVRAGVHPRPEEFKDADRATILASRLWHNADYARRLRDKIEGRSAG